MLGGKFYSNAVLLYYATFQWPLSALNIFYFTLGFGWLRLNNFNRQTVRDFEFALLYKRVTRTFGAQRGEVS